MTSSPCTNLTVDKALDIFSTQRREAAEGNRPLSEAQITRREKSLKKKGVIKGNCVVALPFSLMTFLFWCFWCMHQKGRFLDTPNLHPPPHLCVSCVEKYFQAPLF
jgi:hypothetical protein